MKDHVSNGFDNFSFVIMEINQISLVWDTSFKNM